METKLNAIQQFTNYASIQISIVDFIINVTLVVILGHILNKLYCEFGHSLSNRATLGRTFMFLALTTMVIITIVKSSLALSLGLVGALSIVRFRTAIKEPEELVYLFISICIGIGLGADQRIITLLFFAILPPLIYFNKLQIKSTEGLSSQIVISTPKTEKNILASLTDIFKSEKINNFSLKRIDESEKGLELILTLSDINFDSLMQLQNKIRKIHPDITFQFLEA